MSDVRKHEKKIFKDFFFHSKYSLQQRKQWIRKLQEYLKTALKTTY